MKKFYPIPADAAAKNVNEAVAHSIKKWKGLREENLEKHSLIHRSGTSILEDKKAGTTIFLIDVSTCALCKYAEETMRSNIDDKDGYADYCDYCPLGKIDNCNTPKSGYGIFIKTGNPEPMISNLVQIRTSLDKL